MGVSLVKPLLVAQDFEIIEVIIFYLASGVAGNSYGSNVKIYDIKIYKDDEIRWQVTPNKITYSKEFKEVDGTTKMMPDGSLYSTTFKEV